MMLHGAIPAAHYHRPDVFANERDAVFRRAWMFVGFAEDLANHQDFVTAELGGISVVVQNFEGELRAFRNVCSHRFSKIQCAGKGNRPLTCPYHGWTYNREGVPVGIPHNETNFGLDRAGKAKLALEQFQVDRCGRFVFVRMDPGGPDLRTFLHNCWDLLSHCTEVFTDHFDAYEFEIAANWKIVVENALEGYHLKTVHNETFAPAFADLEIETVAYGDHAGYLGHISDHAKAWWDNSVRRLGMAPSTVYREYDNFLLFPNIVMTLSYGCVATFQTMEPVSIDRTRFRSWMALAHAPGGRKSEAVHKAVTASMRNLSHRILDEDKGVCEVVQSAIGQVAPDRLPVFGHLEARVHHFHNRYMAWMAGTEGDAR